MSSKHQGVIQTLWEELPTKTIQRFSQEHYGTTTEGITIKGPRSPMIPTPVNKLSARKPMRLFNENYM